LLERMRYEEALEEAEALEGPPSIFGDTADVYPRLVGERRH